MEPVACVALWVAAATCFETAAGPRMKLNPGFKVDLEQKIPNFLRVCVIFLKIHLFYLFDPGQGRRDLASRTWRHANTNHSLKITSWSFFNKYIYLSWCSVSAPLLRPLSPVHCWHSAQVSELWPLSITVRLFVASSAFYLLDGQSFSVCLKFVFQCLPVRVGLKKVFFINWFGIGSVFMSRFCVFVGFFVCLRVRTDPLVVCFLRFLRLRCEAWSSVHHASPQSSCCSAERDSDRCTRLK